MKRHLICLLGLFWIMSGHARPLFVDGFDPPHIDPLFPMNGGEFQLPPGPTTDQLEWLLGELAADATTTIDEINAHFDPAWLSQTSATATQAFIQAVRADYPDAVVTDVVSVTPVRLTVVIDSPGSPPPSGYLSLGARYTGNQGIVLFGVGSYGGTVQYPADQTLSLTQAADKFATLSSSPALLVGRIGSNGQCTEIIGRNPTQARATASVFKIWVMGATARAIAANTLASADELPMVASEIAPGGTINSEPLNTLFTVADLATLMLGISDNTATDLLHERVGREALATTVVDFGFGEPGMLLPFLGISEQFHLFYSFPLKTSLSYVNGTESFQQQFLDQQIVPLGPSNGGPYFHPSLLTTGSWQATPYDICAAFSAMRQLPQGSEAILTADAALGASVAQPDVRGDWDRVWYKGGSLAASANNFHVLTHAWMLENAGEDPYVVIALSNSSGGGIDQFAIQSITGRLLELVSQMP